MIALLIVLVAVLSILLIWKGSDWVTDSMVPVATKLGTGYIAITTLLVSALISIPEVFTSIYSYFLGHLEVGIGVLIGSVMVNIGLTVGISAAIKPIFVDKSIVIRDGVFLIVVALVVLIFGSDLSYQRPEGIVLLVLFIPYALNVWFSERLRPVKSQKEKVESIENNLKAMGDSSFFNLKPSMFAFFLGAGVLILGSYLFSYSLIELSKILPLPGILVGIIFGGLGTGLPNIVAAIEGTRKGYEDAAITETFGSNIFTLLITLGILIVLKPFSIAGKIFYFDLTWMIVIHLLMISFIFKGYNYGRESISRFEGMALIFFYIAIVVVNTFFL